MVYVSAMVRTRLDARSETSCLSVSGQKLPGRWTARLLRVVSLFTLLIIFCPEAQAADVESAAESAAKQQLRRECDELIARAVRRPYGWAWSMGEADPKPHGG